MSQVTVTRSTKEDEKFTVKNETWGNGIEGDCLDHTKDHTQVLFEGSADEVQQYLTDNGIEEVVIIGQ